MEKPELIRRLEASLAARQLPANTNIMIDLGKSFNSSWVLYFTEGIYHLQGRSMTVTPSYMQIIPEHYEELIKYNIYFNPMTCKFQLYRQEQKPCSRAGHFVGDFMIKGCQIVFNPPQDECWRYAGSFSSSFQPGYEIGGEWHNICEDCTDFTFEYNESFNNTLTMCSKNKVCKDTVGGIGGAEFIVRSQLLPQCVIAKGTGCSNTVGGYNGKQYNVQQPLDKYCVMGAK